MKTTSLPRSFTRFTAFVTASAFLSTQVVFAHAPIENIWKERRRSAVDHGADLASLGMAPAMALPALRGSALLDTPSRSAALPDVDLAALVRPFGDIQESAAPAATGRRVILIQDVHLNTEAQRNVAGLLSALIDAGRVKMVAVEGAEGRFDFSDITAGVAPATIRRVAERFLETNRISAPSFVGVQRRGAVELVGVDDGALYAANKRAYLESLALRPSAEAALSAIRLRVARAKAASYNSDLANFDRSLQRYAAGSATLSSFVTDLLGAARTGGVEVPESLRRFADACAIESKLDLERVDAERTQALTGLAKGLSEAEVRHATSLALAYKSGQMSNAAYYAHLKRLLSSHGVDLAMYPHFSLYLSYVALADGIDGRTLSADLAELERRVEAGLVRTATERRLADESRMVTLCERLVRFSLTPPEWAQYSAYRIEGQSHVNPWGLSLAPFEDFYREADRRSRAIVTNIESRLGGGDAALVAGGFHTPHLAELLHDAGIGFVIVSPRLTRVDGDGSAYLSIFSREKAPLERVFAGEKLFLYPDAVLLGRPAGPNAEFAGLVRALETDGGDVVTVDVNGAPRHYATRDGAAPLGYLSAGRAETVDGKVRRPVVSLGQTALSAWQGVARRVQRAWDRVSAVWAAARPVVRHPAFAPALVVALVVMAQFFGAPAETLYAAAMVIPVSRFRGDEDEKESDEEAALRELGVNFDPRFHVEAARLQNKPRDQWSAADHETMARLRRESERAYDWMQGYFRKSPLYEKLKGHPVAALSMEGIVSGVEEGEGRRITSFAGGLGVLFGEWIRAIAYLGGTTTLDRNSDAPEFTIFLPDYRDGVRRSELDPFGRPKATSWVATRPSDHDIPRLRDVYDNPVTISITLEPGFTVNVQARPVAVGGLRVFFLNTDANDDASRAQAIFDKLYGDAPGSVERLQQEWVLGLAAFELRKKYNLPLGPVHLNETATFSYLIGLMRDHMRDFIENKDYSLEEAYEASLRMVGGQTVFFTHTLVAAGIDRFDLKKPLKDYIRNYFAQVPFLRPRNSRHPKISSGRQAELIAEWLANGKSGTNLPSFRHNDHYSPLNFVARLVSQYGGSMAAVSQLNAIKAGQLLVAEKILGADQVENLRIIGVTNGVDRIYWMIPFLSRLMNWLAPNPGEWQPWKILNPADPQAAEVAAAVGTWKTPGDYTEPAVSDSDLRAVFLESKIKAIRMIRSAKRQEYIRNLSDLIEMARRGVEWTPTGDNVRQQLERLKGRWKAWTGQPLPDNFNDMTREQVADVLNSQEPVNLFAADALLVDWSRRGVNYKRMLLGVFGRHLPVVEAVTTEALGTRRELNIGQIDELIDTISARTGLSLEQLTEPFLRLINEKNAQFVFLGPVFEPQGGAFVAMLHRVIDRLAERHPQIHNRVVFVEGYDETRSQYLVRGADVWMNTPKYPLEASGTSGMKVSAGINIFAFADGWAAGGLKHGLNGLARGIDPKILDDAPAHLEKSLFLEHPDIEQPGMPNGWGAVYPDLRRRYLESEAQGLYDSLAEAADLYRADREGRSNAWLNLVRRSNYSLSTIYDIRLEFVPGRNVPSFPRYGAAGTVPGGIETTITELYARAVDTTRLNTRFVEFQRAFRFVRLVRDQSTGAITVRFSLTGKRADAFLAETNIRLRIVPRDGGPADMHVPIAGAVELPAQTNATGDPVRTFEVTVTPAGLAPDEYRATTYAMPSWANDADVRQPDNYYLWRGQPHEDLIWRQESATPGAVGAWKAVGVRNPVTAGALEGGIVIPIATLLLAGVFAWLGLSPDAFALVSAGQGVDALFAFLPSLAVAVPVVFALLFVAHYLGGVLDADGNVYGRLDARTALMATFTASSSFVFIPFFALGLVFGGVIGVGVGGLGLAIAAIIHARLNARAAAARKAVATAEAAQIAARRLDAVVAAVRSGRRENILRSVSDLVGSESWGLRSAGAELVALADTGALDEAAVSRLRARLIDEQYLSLAARRNSDGASTARSVFAEASRAAATERLALAPRSVTAGGVAAELDEAMAQYPAGAAFRPVVFVNAGDDVIAELVAMPRFAHVEFRAASAIDGMEALRAALEGADAAARPEKIRLLVAAGAALPPAFVEAVALLGQSREYQGRLLIHLLLSFLPDARAVTVLGVGLNDLAAFRQLVEQQA